MNAYYLELFWLGFIQKILTYYKADFEKKKNYCCFSTNLDVNWNMKSISRKRTKWHAVLEAHYTDVRYGKSVRYNHSACYVSWDSLSTVPCAVYNNNHRYFLSPQGDQEIHNARGNNATQACKEVPRPMKEYWSAWLLVLLVCSKSGVRNTRCYKKI